MSITPANDACNRGLTVETSDQDSFGQALGGQMAAPMPEPMAGDDRTRKWVLIGLIALAVIAIASVAFATMNAGSDATDSPEAAMQEFFDALSSEDLVAAVGTFLPSEADAAIKYADSITAELKRLTVLIDEADPTALDGINMEFTDLEFRTEEVAPGFARVYVSNGEALLDIDQADLPLGQLILDNIPAEEFSQDLPPESDSMAGENFYLMAVEDDGAWYLSFWYTVLDYGFTAAGYGTPAFGSGVQAIGAESAEAAVEAAFQEALALDLEGLIGMLPPTEMRALYDYLPLAMDDFDSAVGGFGAFITIDLKSLGTSVSDADDGAKRVKVETFDIAVDSMFDIDGTISFDGTCFDVTIDDPTGALSQFGVPVPDHINSCDPALGGTLGSGVPGFELPAFPGELANANTGLLVVEENGRWYVSPTETIGDGILGALKAWDKDTLQDYIDWALELGRGVDPGSALLGGL